METWLRTWLINIFFRNITDCRALVYLNTQKTKNPQAIRWASLISDYEFDIVHRQDDTMLQVDALSRAPVDENDSAEIPEQ